MVRQALTDLWTEAVAAGSPAGATYTGVALACVGSTARDELGPCSDVDLVLVHDGHRPTAEVAALAERLWYPLWDARWKIDHSVRTPDECVQVAGDDVSAAMGLLDLTPVAGDAGLVDRTRSKVAEIWRRRIRKRIDHLVDSVAERAQISGDAAHLLEPDLKEARGGLRDLTVLRSLTASWLVDRPHVGLADHHNLLLDVRDALHVGTRRAVDRLLLAEVAEVSERLGFESADDLRIRVSLAARHVAHALDLTLRDARQVVSVKRVFGRERKPQLSREPYGLIVHDGEVGLDRGTDPADPVVGLRAGALAADRRLALSPTTAANLGRATTAVPLPWSDAPREALLDLLATGEGLIPIWESLDLAGCVVTWIPAWAGIRARPQHNPLHRHTVDRHTVQAVAEAHRFLTTVSRPDLLLMAVLLHDIGKIAPAVGSGPVDAGPSAWAGTDHAEVGAPIAARTMTELGFAPADVDLVTRLVRHHLTLAELATRRDHADRATMRALLDAVDHDADTLGLLRALTEADARAAGPAAWSSWRAALINGLTERAAGRLDEHATDLAQTPTVDLGLARSVALDHKPRVRYEPRPGGVEITIAAMDRLGLFADTAGLFVRNQISIRSAVLDTIDPGGDGGLLVAVNTWRVDRLTRADLPDPAVLANQLERLTGGEQDALAAVRRRERRSQPGAEPVVRQLHQASAYASVVEVRSADRPGLLWALGTALSEQQVTVRSAHISTLAGQALDTFYLTEPAGGPLDDDRVGAAIAALTTAARGGSD